MKTNAAVKSRSGETRDSADSSQSYDDETVPINMIDDDLIRS
jgi:hypothetical protein